LALQRLADRPLQEAVAPQRNSDETPWTAGFARAQVA